MGSTGASPSLISRGNRLSEILFLLIDRQAACNIQDVRQLLEKTMIRRTGTHIHEKNETPDNSWTKNHQNGKHWQTSQTGGTLHSVWKKSYLEITSQYGWITAGNPRAYWNMLA